MAGGRRGRPYQVPVDPTSLQSATIDIDARVGWLMLMSRLHGSDQDLSLGDNFNTALAEVGLQADRSALSRWESGKVTPRYAVLTAYEKALDLRPGQLTGVVNALRRAFAERPNRVWAPVLDPRTDRFHERLDGLIDAILGGEATGEQWASFGHHLAATQTMYLPAPMWSDLSTRLIDQMARSVGVSYLQRFEALRIVLAHRRGGPALLHATADYLHDPAVQVINDPIGVLEISGLPAAGDLLLEMFLTTESEEVFDGCVWAIAYKVEMGHFSSAELNRIEEALRHKLDERRGDVTGLEELLVAMPETVRARLLDTSAASQSLRRLHGAVEHGESIRPDVAKRVAERIADRVRAALPRTNLYDEDTMTPRIIREALFAFRTEIRHYACLTLLGSPFRTPLAEILVDEIDSHGWEEALTPRLTRVLRYLAGPNQEPVLLDWVRRAPAPVAKDMALTIGHLPASGGDLGVLVGRLAGDHSALDRALMYGLGMRQDPALSDLAADAARPAYVQAAANWWLGKGGAIHR